MESLKGVGSIVLGDKVVNRNEVDLHSSNEMTLQDLFRGLQLIGKCLEKIKSWSVL